MERIHRIINHPNFKLYLRNNSHLEKDRIFCTHNFDHLLAVARLTYLLLLERGEHRSIKEIAYAAGLLHDIGRWQEYTKNIDHAVASAELARPILEFAGFEQSEVKLILNAIREHRRDNRPVNDNLHPLSEALHKADLYSRLCFKCPVKKSCRKYPHLPHGENLCC